MKLSVEQKAAYGRDGFLVFPNLVTPEEVAKLTGAPPGCRVFEIECS